MIDPSLFTVERLLAEMLDDQYGNRNAWLKLVSIEPKYKAPYAAQSEAPKCVVRCGNSFLRYSQGPRNGYFWDCYGDDFLRPELALLSVLQAPVPPWVLKHEAWGAP